MKKKYELTDVKIEVSGKTLFRIRALRDIEKYGVKKGDLGGYIEKEDNLSHDGDAWVSDDAKVCDNARVYGDAWVSGNVEVYENARVHGHAMIESYAKVYGKAEVFGNVWEYGRSRVYGDAKVYGNAKLQAHARVYGDARVCGNALIYDATGLLWISKIGSWFGTMTAFREEVFEEGQEYIKIKCGCFEGTLNEFEKKVEETHGDDKYGREYKAAIELIKIHFAIDEE